jgi:hypothetical protein
MAQQLSEALARERLLGDLAAAEGRPQRRVDLLVRAQRGRGARQAEGTEGLPERLPLGPVEVEQRVVDVEEDGSEAGQATSRGT